ncbi:MAG: type II toxin-antitoxin system RelE family toxin [Pirellulales bacterium]
MAFTLDFTQSALDDLAVFQKHEQTRILDRIAVQLPPQPSSETRNRKPLEPNSLADWEQRIGNFRVFYDVDETLDVVKVKAVAQGTQQTLYSGQGVYPLKTIDLARDETSREQIFQLAEQQNLLVRTAEGKLFVVAEVGDVEHDDFADEVARTQNNPELRELLAERSQEPGVLNIDEVRQKLGLG